MIRSLSLFALLVAGVASAQPGPMNCRTRANDCWASKVYVTGGEISFETYSGAGAHAGGKIKSNIDGNFMYVTTSFRVQGNIYADGKFYGGAGAGVTQYEMQTGAWFDLGGGTNDRIKSDGSNVLVDTHLAPNVDGTLQLGGTINQWSRGYFKEGAVLGPAMTWDTTPLTNNTLATSQVLYNSSARELSYNNVRAYMPVGGAKDWVLEKRELRADLGFENANCPVGAPGIRGTGAAAVTFSCTDAAAATTTTVEAETFRLSTTAASASSVSLVDVSGNVTKLELGPRLKQRVMVPTGSNASVRLWLALVPTATSLSGVDTGAVSVIGFRFSTTASDATWQACTGNGTSVVCVNTGIPPSIQHQNTLEIDCREITACRFLIEGSLVASQKTTSSMPSVSTQLAPRLLVQTTNGTAKAFGYGRMGLDTN